MEGSVRAFILLKAVEIVWRVSSLAVATGGAVTQRRRSLLEMIFPYGEINMKVVHNNVKHRRKVGRGGKEGQERGGEKEGQERGGRRRDRKRV